jgi:hypothetical protein
MPMRRWASTRRRRLDKNAKRVIRGVTWYHNFNGDVKIGMTLLGFMTYLQTFHCHRTLFFPCTCVGVPFIVGFTMPLLLLLEGLLAPETRVRCLIPHG